MNPKLCVDFTPGNYAHISGTKHFKFGMWPTQLPAQHNISVQIPTAKPNSDSTPRIQAEFWWRQAARTLP